MRPTTKDIKSGDLVIESHGSPDGGLWGLWKMARSTHKGRPVERHIVLRHGGEPIEYNTLALMMTHVNGLLKCNENSAAWLLTRAGLERIGPLHLIISTPKH